MNELAYIRYSKRFLRSHHLSDGIRMTMGILIPSLSAAALGFLGQGIFLAIGAMCVSLSDNQGPIHHRRNGLLAGSFLICALSLLVGLSLAVPLGYPVLVLIFCFLLSFIGVYGARVAAIGIGALLILILTPHLLAGGTKLGIYSLLLLAGGLWYTLFTLLLNRLRPYALIRQALGEYIIEMADYLTVRGEAYNPSSDLASVRSRELQAQLDVLQKQALISEMIFKTRGLTRESNPQSRSLLMAFLDVNDLLERTMAAHTDIAKLRESLQADELLRKIADTLNNIARELERVALAISAGTRIARPPGLITDARALKIEIDAFGTKHPSALNWMPAFFQISSNIEEIATRTASLYQYTQWEQKDPGMPSKERAANFVQSPGDYRFESLKDNLSWNSTIFRHSIRIVLAAVMALIAGQFWQKDHSYWILLTAVIIIKPEYGSTKNRNRQRILGTLMGAALAWGILYFSRNNYVNLGLMALFMLGGFSFLRWKYLPGVFFITMYLMFLFHLLEPQHFSLILGERIIATLVGAAIAFLVYQIVPSIWEKLQIGRAMKQAIIASRTYFQMIAPVYLGTRLDPTIYTRRRKEVWVALANLTDALNRMLSDPKSEQTHIREWHRAVVASQEIINHTATLARLTDSKAEASLQLSLEASLARIQKELSKALALLEPSNEQSADGGSLEASEIPHPLVSGSSQVLLDQFMYIENAAKRLRSQLELIQTS